jgi:hypothetical protein
VKVRQPLISSSDSKAFEQLCHLNERPKNYIPVLSVTNDPRETVVAAFSMFIRSKGLSINQFVRPNPDDDLEKVYEKISGKEFDQEANDSIEEYHQNLFTFYMPQFSNDETINIIQGNKYSVYRIVKNNGKLYFDSFVPLKQFVFRKRFPWTYLDVLSMSQKEIEKIVDYSNDMKNNLVGINRIESDFKNYIMVRMDYLDQKKMTPLVTETTSFTLNEDIKKQSERFNFIADNPEILSKIYDASLNLIKSMPEKTGFRLTDVSLNNIMASENAEELTFIDVVDIKRKRELIQHDMSSIFTITQERLHPDFYKNLSAKSKKFFPTYQFKNNPDNKGAIEDFKNQLFIDIKRSRFVTDY